MPNGVDISVIMPVLNGMRYLPRVIPPLLAAGRRRGNVEFLFVDNGSTDGSQAFLACLEQDARLLALENASVSALRNRGAREARGGLLSFLDADCEIGLAYFDDAVKALEASTASAAGHQYDLPPDPGWIEHVWHTLHFRSVRADVDYVNAGNFLIRRSAFEDVGGFREDLWTGEDAELGQRLNAAGYRIRSDPSVRAVHLGNPKSVRQFFRRQVWHGVGMFGTVDGRHIDKPTAMMCLHLLLSVAGMGILLAAPLSLPGRIALAIGGQLIAPALTSAYRLCDGREWRAAPAGVFLYWLYYWARIQALALIVSGRAARYRK